MTVILDPTGLLTGIPFGKVYPPEPPPAGLPDKDAREHALERFADFISLLVFQRTGSIGGKPISFRVPRESVHIFQPDDVKDLTFPCIGILPGRGVHESYGLGPPVMLDDTVDLFGKGTVLVRQSDYTETIVVEVIGAKHAERRAIVAGLKEALRAVDDSYATRMILPDYFDQVAEFSLNDSQYIDDDHAVRNRRRAHLFVDLVVPEVFLVRYREFRPEVAVEVEDGQVLALQALLADEEG